VASISLLLGGLAEAMEIVVQPKAYVTQDQLQYLELPKGVIIGAVLRGECVLIPDGTTQIETGRPGSRVPAQQVKCPALKSIFIHPGEDYSVNYGIIAKVIGSLLIFEAAMFLPAFVAGFYYHETSSLVFLGSWH
jgi:hypothetical protein